MWLQNLSDQKYKLFSVALDLKKNNIKTIQKEKKTLFFHLIKKMHGCFQRIRLCCACARSVHVGYVVAKGFRFDRK